MTTLAKILAISTLTVLLLPAAFAHAENPGPASASGVMGQPAADAPEAEREAYWRARAQEARNRVSAARERVAASAEDYGRMRHRNRQRGEPRADMAQDRSAANAELEAALRYLEVELPEEARRAGALPGWLRE